MAHSRRDRRTIAIGIALIGGLLCWKRGWPAWRSWTANRVEAASEVRAQLAAIEASVAGAEAVRESLDARRARLLDLGPQLLDGESPASGAATLAAFLSGAAVESRLELGALQLAADAARAGAFAQVSVRASATGDVRGVAAFLAHVERGPLLLAVRELSVDQADPAGAPDRPEALRMSIRVNGLVLRRGEGSP